MFARDDDNSRGWQLTPALAGFFVRAERLDVTEDKTPAKDRLSGRGLSDQLKADREAAKRNKKAKAEAVRRKRRAHEKPNLPDAAADLPSSVLAEIAAECDECPPGDMISRLYQAFAGQMDQLEARLSQALKEAGEADSPDPVAEIDKTVKTLASLAKTLTVLLEMQKEQEEDGAADDLPETDELRQELADRLGRLCKGGAD